MAGIIKNQLLKHLSRFVKQLSSDRINLSTFKGEGELTNLELDEEVLTDLLALPTWMKIKKATCNRVNIRIPWTRLKSHPIHLALDHVHVQIETCEELRKTAADVANHFQTSAGKYGFVNKVVDGITLTVESVEMTFHSREFESRVQISRIRVESRSPQWRSNVELSHSRLKDVRRGEVLVFKEVIWQNLRLEAQSTSDRHLAPLRLLTNQGKARIVIKKRLNDCQVVACRLSIILDELLWVLTDSQILAALHFINSLSGLVKQATEESQRIKAKRKLETLPEFQAQQHQATAMNSSGGGGSANDATKIFEAFDIKETSYHFICDKINLHLLDDPGNGRSIHPDLSNGAALQIHFAQIMLDFYPYHLARASRKSWPRYGENQVFHWLKEAMEHFNVKLMETILPQQQQYAEHRPLVRTSVGGIDGYSYSNSGANSPVGTPMRSSVQPPSDNNSVRATVGDKIAKLMSTCLVIRIQNVCIYKVTTNAKESLQPFLSGYMERPKDLHGVHIEFTWFYHPGEVCFPLPSPKIYVYLHPIQMDLDICTVLWLNSFASNLAESLNKVETSQEEAYADIRLELIQPKVMYRSKPYPGQKSRPSALYFQLSRVVIANYRSVETGTHQQLAQCLEKVGTSPYGNTRRTSSTSSMHFYKPSLGGHSPNSERLARFLRHCNNEDLVRQTLVQQQQPQKTFPDFWSSLTKEMLWTEPRDIWYLRVESFWADFCFESASSSSSSSRRRAPMARFESITSEHGGVWGALGGDQLGPPSPFIDPCSLSGWIHVPPPPSSSPSTENESHSKPLCVLLNSLSLVNVQMTHYQYLFLMRMVESFGELSMYLNLDTERVIGEAAAQAKELFLMLYIPRIEVSFLFPCLPSSAQSHLPRDNSMASENGTQSSPSPSTDFPTCTPMAVMMMQSTVSEPSLAYQQQNNLSTPNIPQQHALSQSVMPPPPLETKTRSVHTLMDPSTSSLSASNKISPLSVSASPLSKPIPTLDMISSSNSKISPLSVSAGSHKQIPTLDMLTDNLKQGMKQGLSTVFAFSKTGGLSTPDSEVASTFSTSGSSDNIQFEHLELDPEQDGASTNQTSDQNGLDDDNNVEIALEVVEDDAGADLVVEPQGNFPTVTTVPNLSNNVPNGPRSHEYESINVLVVQLNDVIVCQEAKALDSDIRVSAASLEFDEIADIQWQEFQRRFIARSKKWRQSRTSTGDIHPRHQQPSSTAANGVYSGKPVVQVHLSQKIDGNMVKAYDWRSDKSSGTNTGSGANSGAFKLNLIDAPGEESLMRKLITDATEPSLKAHVDLSMGPELVFNMSSIVNLTDLVEDEIVPVPFPVEIALSGGKIKLIEDRPPVNITSPGAPPIKVHIAQTIKIFRDEYGVIYIGEKGSPHVKEKLSLKQSFTERMSACDLLKSLTINDYRGEDEEDEDDDDFLDPNDVVEEYSEDQKKLRKLNKIILQMEQKLKELKSEKCNLLIRINCNQTEKIINKQN